MGDLRGVHRRNVALDVLSCRQRDAKFERKRWDSHDLEKSFHISLSSPAACLFCTWQHIHWSLILRADLNRDHCRQIFPKSLYWCMNFCLVENFKQRKDQFCWRSKSQFGNSAICECVNTRYSSRSCGIYTGVLLVLSQAYCIAFVHQYRLT